MATNVSLVSQLLNGCSSAAIFLSRSQEAQLDLKTEVAPLIARLPQPPYDLPNAAMVLNLRLGLHDGRIYSQIEIAAMTEVALAGFASRAAVSRLERVGLDYLHEMASVPDDPVEAMLRLVHRKHRVRLKQALDRSQEYAPSGPNGKRKIVTLEEIAAIVEKGTEGLPNVGKATMDELKRVLKESLEGK